MNTSQAIFIPVIVGTPRQGRMSEYVAEFVVGEVTKCNGLNFTTALTEPSAVDSNFGGILEEVHTCLKCKNIEVCRAS